MSPRRVERFNVGGWFWNQRVYEMEQRRKRWRAIGAMVLVAVTSVCFMLLLAAAAGCSTEAEAPPAPDAGSDALSCELPPPCDLSDNGAGAARVQVRIWCGDDSCGRRVAACDGPVGGRCAINETRLCAESCAGVR